MPQRINSSLAEQTGTGGKAHQQRWQGLWSYLVTLFLCLLITTLVLKLWHADWHVPFVYGGDALFYSMMIKGISDNGWHWQNKFLGMPWGAELYDFPIPDTFHVLVIKLATLWIADYALILNLFFVCTFPLTALVTLAVLRHFKVTFPPALLASLLYTFTPYHLSRSENHLLLSAYYMIPLMVMVILWVCASNGDTKDHDPYGMKVSVHSPKFLVSLLVCVLSASTGGVYYAFFANGFLLVVGCIVALSQRSIRRFLLPGVLIAVISATMLANLSPSILYQWQHGKTRTVQRVPQEAEIYGLKIAQLLLPMTDHRLAAWKQLKARYNQNPLITENDDASLGVIGSSGFVVLLGWLLSRSFSMTPQKVDARERLFSHLSVLNMTAVLFGTIGGFSALFALLVSPQIRAVNRISVYIACFAFFTVALLLDRVGRWCSGRRGGRIAFHGLIGVLLIVGIVDQSSQRFVPAYVSTHAEYRNDADFIHQIEATLPAGAMIFQLPLQRFPEGSPVERILHYELAKGYLHSRQLRWTYGAMKEREGEMWQRQVVAKPLTEMVETIALAGFDGMYVDRFGYADQAAKLEAELTSLLGEIPFVSPNKRLAFFNLSVYLHALRGRYTAQKLVAKREEMLYPVLSSWQGDCFELEGTFGNEWHWCGPTGQLILDNRAPRARRVTIEMAFATAQQGHLRITGPFFTEGVSTHQQPVFFSKALELPPGKHLITFASDAPRVPAPRDPRFLVLRVDNFKLQLID